MKTGDDQNPDDRETGYRWDKIAERAPKKSKVSNSSFFLLLDTFTTSQLCKIPSSRFHNLDNK